MKKIILFSLALLFWSTLLSATPALVSGQIASNQSTTNTITVTLPNDPGTGNFVSVAVVVANGRTLTSVVDCNANTYTVTTNSPSSNANRNAKAYITYFENVSNGCKTITVTVSGTGSTHAAFAAEFSGMATSSVLDIDAAHSGTNATTHIIDPSITPAANEELIISVAGIAVNAVNSPYTAIDVSALSGSWAGYYIQPTAALLTVDFNQSSSAQFAAMIAAFKSDGSAAGIVCNSGLLLLGVGTRC